MFTDPTIPDPQTTSLAVYTLSDSTGETAEAVARAAASQFPGQRLSIDRLPRVLEVGQIPRIVERLAQRQPCLIGYTFVVPGFREALETAASQHGIPCVDLLGTLIRTMGSMLGMQPSPRSGLLHTLDAEYFARMEAIEFAIKFDDGKDPRGLLAADIVLTGVSRTSKTPTCMYLAQNRGMRAGNVPLVKGVAAPPEMFSLERGRVVGLTIDPALLYEIRVARLAAMGLPRSSDYAKFENILSELQYAGDIMHRLGCPIVDVSHKAIEETASEILLLLR
ncbi:MAG: kinase/pyrophosphorylase [Candidatus Sericytochromatia bacterium]|nr:kinase/pyrophosphorylase [Candidatus Sericytochromatia bacterium]